MTSLGSAPASDDNTAENAPALALPFFVSLGIFLLAVALIHYTWRNLNEYNQEAFRVPLGMLSATAILSLFQASVDLRKMRISRPTPDAMRTCLRIAAFLTISVLFVFLIPLTGYVATGIVLFYASAHLAGRVTQIATLMCAVIVPLAIYLAFGLFFSIWLPGGQVFEGLM